MNDFNKTRKEDEKKIAQLLSKVVHNATIEKIERLGGLSNRNYYIKTPKEEYVVRLAGFGTQFITNRKDEKISTQLANSIGIDSQLIYFDSKTGDKIALYIKDSKTLNPQELRKEENIIRVVETFKKLHNSNKDTQIPFNIIQTITMYEKIIDNSNISYFDDYNEIRSFVYPSAQKQVISPIKVPCHNDPVCENWILQKDRMYLIDWEYGGMNNPIWDLALVSCEAQYSKENDETLLKNYLDKETTKEDIKELILNKIIIDFYLSLWAKTRIPYDGQLMIDYSYEHYNRSKKNMEILVNL